MNKHIANHASPGLEGYHRSAEVKLLDEVGVKQASAQLGVPYYPLAEVASETKGLWGPCLVGSGVRRDAPLSENERRLAKENAELRRANEILKDALVFFAKDRKK